MRSGSCSSPSLAWFLAVVAIGGGVARAQVDRYELGLRLRAFERRLAATPDPERRAQAFAALDRAVQAFFRLDTRTVAAAIAAADRALSAAPDDAQHRCAASVQLQLDARLVATGTATLPLRVSTAFDAAASDDGGRDSDADADVGADGVAELGLTLVIAPLPGTDTPLRVPLTELPLDATLPLAGVPVGDHELSWSIVAGDDVLAQRAQELCVADAPAERIAQLDAVAQRAAAIAPPTIESRTLPALLDLLRGMQRRRGAETSLPGNRLLAEAEALAASLDEGGTAPFYGDPRPGSFWLRVPTADGVSAVRLFVPPAADGRRPLVVALHGAGGSENLFFDGYGDGLVVSLAAARGFYVVAPRLAFGAIDVAVLVDALAARFAIDRDRVLLLGHSMGAMQAIANAMRTPERFRAVAALGGGGRVPAGAAIRGRPFFVGAGERDFGRGGARALQRALAQAGAKAEWREYPAVEHLAIVQVALPDVFEFFAAAAR